MEIDLNLVIWIAVAVVVLALIVFLVLRAKRMRRRKHLRERFGLEYDRTAQRAGSKRKADEELAEREERYERFDLHRLDDDERESLRARWEDLQSSFVDGPHSAVRMADVLLDDAARARGYHDAGPEQRLRDLAIDYPDEVERYRQAVAATTDGDDGRDAERLRRWLLAARGLFEAVLGPEPTAKLVSPEPPFASEPAPDDEREAKPPLGRQPEATPPPVRQPDTAPPRVRRSEAAPRSEDADQRQ